MWFELWRQKRKLTFSQRASLRFYLGSLEETVDVLEDSRLDNPAITRLERVERATKAYAMIQCAEVLYREAWALREKCVAEGIPETTINLADTKLFEKYRLRQRARLDCLAVDLMAANF